MSTGSIPFDPVGPSHPPVIGQPAWDLALLYPPQGQWSEEEYLSLTDSTNWLVEFTDGKIEVLSMPTIEHQLIVKFLLMALDSFVKQHKRGLVLFAPTRVYIDPKKYREPDLVFNFAARHARSGKRYHQGADLVMEVVSDDVESHKRDWEQKRLDYAEGKVPEYWIVDPQLEKITVLTLEAGAYLEHGTFIPGETATSKLLTRFATNVADVFAAAKQDM